MSVDGGQKWMEAKGFTFPSEGSLTLLLWVSDSNVGPGAGLLSCLGWVV